MYTPITEKFEHACRNSGKVVTTADVYLSGSLVLEGAAVFGGSITVDANANIRRSAQFSIINPGSTTTSGLRSVSTQQITTIDLLRSEIAIFHGFEYSNGQQELVRMGQFMVWSADIAFDKGDVLELELYDKAKYLEQTDILHVYD